MNFNLFNCNDLKYSVNYYFDQVFLNMSFYNFKTTYTSFPSALNISGDS